MAHESVSDIEKVWARICEIFPNWSHRGAEVFPFIRSALAETGHIDTCIDQVFIAILDNNITVAQKVVFLDDSQEILNVSQDVIMIENDTPICIKENKILLSTTKKEEVIFIDDSTEHHPIAHASGKK